MDITSANAVVRLIVDILFPTGFDLQMFSTDSAVSLDSIDISDSRIGVDGVMVSGYIPSIKPLTITLEAASPSYENMTTLFKAMETSRRPYNCTLLATVPSIRRVFTWSNGVLASGTPFPSLNQTLDVTTWVFNFQKLDFQRL